MMIPGLSGFEGNVRRYIKGELAELGIKSRTDMLGNLIATIEGDADLPSVMLIAHMDQLGLIVRKIEATGLIRAERVGGVPERALAAQEVLLSVGHGRTVAGIIANKSHHATTPDEKYRVVPYQELYIDCGFSSAEEAVKAGITVGTPIVYAPNVVELAGGRIGGTSVGSLAEHYGWRSGFCILGLLGIGLAFLSSLFLTDGPTKPVAKADRLSFAVALRYLARVPTYYLLMGKTMLAGIGTWIFFSWMPLYFHDTFGLGLAAAAFAGTFTFSAAGMLGTAVGGWLSDRVASRDSRHRMLLLAVSYFASTPFLLTFLFHPSLTLVTAAIVAYSILRGLGAANENPCLCEVVPPQFRSTAVGIMNCMATAAGGGGVLVAGILKKDFGLAMVFGGVSVVIFLAGAAMLTGYYVFMRRDIGRAQVYATTAGA